MPRPAGEPGLHDDRAVGAAYDAHGAELYRFLLRGLGDRGAAQDVLQETFLRAWRSSASYDPARAPLRGWLFAIARNAMIDHARAARVRPWERDLLEPGDADRAARPTADPTEQLLRTWVVEEALQCLSHEMRTAVVQTHLLDRPYADVAAELGIPVGTLRSRVFYALKALRRAIEDKETSL